MISINIIKIGLDKLYTLVVSVCSESFDPKKYCSMSWTLHILYALRPGLGMIPSSYFFFNTAVPIKVIFSFPNTWTNYIYVARDGELVLS